MQVRPKTTETPNLSNPLDQASESWLKSFLESRPEQTFFEPGLYKFNGRTVYLSHCLARRHKYIAKLPTPQIKYDVLEPLTRGAYGLVFESKRTLTLTKKSLRGVNDNHHIVKVTSSCDIPNGINATSIDVVRAEREYLAKDHRSRPKTLQQQTDNKRTLTLQTMRRFSGQSLQSLIDSRTSLDLQTRLRLSIALLRALKEQVHDLGLIHRDIKPGNIIVDITTMEVNIIDFGMCMDKSHPDGKACGTPVYTSPEILKNPDKIDENTDIYSMGRVLAQLWDDAHPIWNEPAIQCMTATHQGKYNLGQLFNNNKNDYQSKNPATKIKIKSAIQKMVAHYSHDRKSINEVINQLHNAFLHECYPKGTDTQQLSDHFNQGASLRPLLLRSQNKDDYLEKMFHALMDLNDDNPPAIKEFAHGLGLNSLQGIDTKETIFSRAHSIFTSYYTAINRYITLVNKASDELEKYDIIFTSDLFSELKEFSLELRQKLDRIKQKPFDLDLLERTTKSLDNKYQYRKSRLDGIIKEVSVDLNEKPTYQAYTPLFNKPVTNKGSTEIDHLRNALRLAMRHYVNTTYTQENLNKKDRAASERRQKDLIDFNNILDDANINDASTLITKTKKRISKIEDGFLGSGLFGNSKLKRNLKKAIIQHKQHFSKSKTQSI